VPIVEAVRASKGEPQRPPLTLTEQLETARAAPAGVNGDQAVDLTRKTSGNFVVTLLRSGYAQLKEEPGFALVGESFLRWRSPAEFAMLIADETEKWAKVVKFAGIRAD
jgi:hypothetical protein